MSSQGEIQRPPRGPPPIPPKPRRAFPSSAPSVQLSRPSAVSSQYLMNDIERNTPRMKIINSLLSPRHRRNDDLTAPPDPLRPDVIFACTITDSRLDDELSVATIELSDTPQWLQYLNDDQFGFPKKTAFGTLWKAVDRNAIDEHGRTEYIRAVMGGNLNLNYAEMIAEFSDTDVNIQDEDGRTALHWASVLNLSDIVRLCLSVPECDVGLKDKDGLTAFDISLRGGNEIIATSFYNSMFELNETHPQEALLRSLTISAEPAVDRPDYPGVAIFDPVMDCNTRLVKALIKRGVDLTATNEDGDTALHIAAAKIDNVEIATMLLEAGADVNAISHDGATPLHNAAETSDKLMVQKLLEWTTTAGAKDNEGKTALERAEEKKDVDMVAVFNKANERGTVAEENQAQDVRQQLTRGGQVGRSPETTDIDETIALNDVAKIDLVGATDGDGKPHKNKDLHQAVLDEDMEIVRSLLRFGADVNSKDAQQQSPLHRAAWKGNTEIAKILLASGAHVSSLTGGNWTPLRMAARYGHTEIVKLLLAAGAQIDVVDNQNWTALHSAARNDYTEIVKVLLDAGAQIDAVNNNNWTALYIAARYGYTEIVELLLTAGAQIDAVDNYNWTALHMAVRYQYTEIVKLLLAAGAQIDAVDNENWTALHKAARGGDTEIVKLLLAVGAQIDAVDNENWTALHKAARHGYTEIVKMLLHAGAQIEMQSPEGTAAQLASRYNHREIVQALKASEAIKAAEAVKAAEALKAAEAPAPIEQNTLTSPVRVRDTLRLRLGLKAKPK